MNSEKHHSDFWVIQCGHFYQQTWIKVIVWYFGESVQLFSCRVFNAKIHRLAQPDAGKLNELMNLILKVK